MTIPEFLQRLRATEGPWELVNGAIRCGGHCPLTRVVDHPDVPNIFGWEDAADRLGLDSNDAQAIVDAADRAKDEEGYDPKLRRRLLNATVKRV